MSWSLNYERKGNRRMENNTSSFYQILWLLSELELAGHIANMWGCRKHTRY